MSKSNKKLILIIAAFFGLGILALVCFLVFNVFLFSKANEVQDKFANANDTRAQEEMQSILGAMSLYVVDNGGELPTYDGGNKLPVASIGQIMTKGTDASSLDNMTIYLSSTPRNPKDNSEYKVIVTEGGLLVVGGTLGDGSVWTVTE